MATTTLTIEDSDGEERKLLVGMIQSDGSFDLLENSEPCGWYFYHNVGEYRVGHRAKSFLLRLEFNPFLEPYKLEEIILQHSLIYDIDW